MSISSAARTRTRATGGTRRGGRGIRLGMVGFATLIAAWYLAWFSGVVSQSLFPRPDQVVQAAWVGFAERDLVKDVGVSIVRVLLGVAIGTGLAIPVGFLLAWYRTLRAMFDPLVSFFRALPPIALVPLVIVYLGIGEQARISILIYASFFASVVVIYEGVAAVDEIYIRAARVLGASEWEIFTKVIVRVAIPQIFVALRVALGVSWATLVAAELLAASNGLGAVIQNAGNFFQIDVIYVGIILIGVLALSMDYVLKLVMARSVRWQERVER